MALSPQDFERLKLQLAQKQATSGSITQAPQPGVVERVGSVINNAGAKVNDAITGQGQYTGQSPLTRGVEATASAFNAIPQVAVAAAPEPVRTAIGAVGDVASKGFSFLTDKIASTKLFSDIGNLEAQGHINPKDNPEFYALKEMLQTASAGGQITGDILAAQGGASAVKTTSKTLARVPEALAPTFAKIGNKTGSIGIEAANKLGVAPADLMQRVARIPKTQQAAFENLANGESIGNYLVNRNIFGNPEQIVTQLSNRMTNSMSSVDRGLAKINATVSTKNPTIVEALKALQENESATTVPGIASLDGKAITELTQRAATGKLSLSDVNLLKRLYERNVRVNYNKAFNAQGVTRATNIDSALRNLIESEATKRGFTTVKELNKETQLARQLIDGIGKENAGSAGNNALGLSDIILLSQAAGNPVAAGGFLARKVGGSKTVMSGIAERLAKDKGSKAALPKVNVNDTTATSYQRFLKENGLVSPESTPVTTPTKVPQDVSLPYDTSQAGFAKNIFKNDIEVTPEIAAKKVTPQEVVILQKFTNEGTLQSFMPAMGILEKLGIKITQVDEKTLKRFADEVISQYAAKANNVE